VRKAEPPLPEPAKIASPEPAASLATKDNRRVSLVRAAYEVIATQGFEGLRTRSVAERAGVNIATLHYYFPTKEALIKGLAEYLASLFVSVHAPAVASTGSAALDRLHQEFADARFYRLEQPDMLVVIQELMLRAHRDPAVRSIIAPLTYHWQSGLQQLIEEGISEGVFRPDLVPVVAATLVASTISGAINFAFGTEMLDNIFREIERWLIISPKNKRPRKH
jgi:TetR/AcrR family transcriptional regulator, regulator of cefoperazone and chloramphenicol sensitivity